jgi:hypothetical protein
MELPFGGDCARLKVVGRLSAAERQFHVRVRVDAAGDNKLTACVNHAVDFHHELCANDGYELIFNQNVCSIVVGGCDDTAIGDKGFHRITPVDLRIQK